MSGKLRVTLTVKQAQLLLGEAECIASDALTDDERAPWEAIAHQTRKALTWLARECDTEQASEPPEEK